MALPNTPLPPILGGISLNLVQIGTTQVPFPNSPQSCFPQNMHGGFLAGDAFFWTDGLQGSSYYNPHFLVGFRVKRDGTSCQILDMSRMSQGNYSFSGENLFQLGTNTFACNDPNQGLLQYLIPDQFVSGGVINVGVSGQSPPPPCGVGNLHSTFYSSAQNLIAYEFVQPFQVNSNIYASIYEQTIHGPQLINGGYVGNAAPGQNVFDLTSQSLPPYVDSSYATGSASSNLSFQGGNSFYFNSGVTGNYSLGATGIVIIQDKNPLVCNQPNANTYVTTANAFNWSQSLLSTSSNWNQYFQNFASNFNGFASENPNVFFMGAGNGTQLLIFNPYFIAFFSLNVQIKTGVIFRDGTLIALGGGGSRVGFPIYMAQIPLLQYGLVERPTIMFQGQGTANINYTRPISLRGAYKA
jgi:hypothetical protein